ncbi:MAG: hypothetical protein CVU59_12710 [Deltaproteobacteria bacterium HGW-Deltaproteobacteria-17]|nr:MAG: hypothetical protein CVU59_12710 [Deltaproteobacteria bacterium HGW-Deltaproteobacteria-17]
MDIISAHWLPIVLSAVAVFFASFITWALLPFHNREYKKIPNEEAVLSALRSGSLAPGEYMFPGAMCGADAQKPEVKEQIAGGPIGLLRVWPGLPNMGRNMALSFSFNLIAAFVIAYVAHLTLATGDSFHRVFRIVTTITFMAYGFGAIPNGIWFAKSARAHALDLIDAAAFAVLTGLIFAWFWPRLEAAIPAAVPSLTN